MSFDFRVGLLCLVVAGCGGKTLRGGERADEDATDTAQGDDSDPSDDDLLTDEDAPSDDDVIGDTDLTDDDATDDDGDTDLPGDDDGDTDLPGDDDGSSDDDIVTDDDITDTEPPVICTPDAERCHDDARERCNNAGTAYDVLETCALGCSSVSLLCYDALGASAGADASIPQNDSTVLLGSATGASGTYTCDWTNDQDLTVIEDDCEPVVAPTVDTTYRLTVTELERGITAEDDVLVTVLAPACNDGIQNGAETGEDCGGGCAGCPDGGVCDDGADCASATCADDSCVVLVASAGDDVTIHVSQAASLLGTAPNHSASFSCTWTNDIDATVISDDCAPSVSPTVTTTYTLTVTSAQTAATATDSVVVTVLPELRALAGADIQAVSGSDVALVGAADNGIGALTCVWTNDKNATVLNDCAVTVSSTSDVTYTLTLTDSTGASDTDEVAITIQPLVAHAGGLQELVVGESTSLSAAWEGATVCNDEADCNGNACVSGSCVECIWTWRADNGLATESQTGCDVPFTPSYSKAYTLLVTDTANGAHDTDRTTVLVSGAESVLCAWDIITFDITGLSNGLADYRPVESACNPPTNGQTITQHGNADPSVAFSGLELENVLVTTKIRVNSTGDDDLIGLIWGWQDAQHFYLFQWKRANQTAPHAACGANKAGMAALKFDGSGSINLNLRSGLNHSYTTAFEYKCADFWATERARSNLLDSGVEFLHAVDDPTGNITGWAPNTTYRFELYYSAQRSRILIYNDGTGALVHSLDFNDTSYPHGGFGAYTHSQDQTVFSNITFRALKEFTADAGSAQSVAAGASVNLVGTASGMVIPPYTCAWETSDGTSVGNTCSTTFFPTETQQYVLVVTDDFGRTATDTVVVAVE